MRDGMLWGNWRGPDGESWLSADDHAMFVYNATFEGATDDPVVPQGGRFDAPGYWRPKSAPGAPPLRDEERRVRFVGQIYLGRVFVEVVDATNGASHFRQWFEDHNNPWPPPSAPPVPR
jgi:hypothetical protein